MHVHPTCALVCISFVEPSGLVSSSGYKALRSDENYSGGGSASIAMSGKGGGVMKSNSTTVPEISIQADKSLARCRISYLW